MKFLLLKFNAVKLHPGAAVISKSFLVPLYQNRTLTMNLSEDRLLKPFRQMAGQAAPGDDLGGWYLYNPEYDWHTQDAGFVLVQPEMERGRSPLVSIHPSGGDFQGIDTTTRLSLSMVAPPQNPLPFRPARSL